MVKKRGLTLSVILPLIISVLTDPFPSLLDTHIRAWLIPSCPLGEDNHMATNKVWTRLLVQREYGYIIKHQWGWGGGGGGHVGRQSCKES